MRIGDFSCSRVVPKAPRPGYSVLGIALACTVACGVQEPLPTALWHDLFEGCTIYSKDESPDILRSGRGRLTLDAWRCMPASKQVHTAVSRLMAYQDCSCGSPARVHAILCLTTRSTISAVLPLQLRDRLVHVL